MTRSRGGSNTNISRRGLLAGGLALGGGLASLDVLGAPRTALAQGTPKRGGTLVAAAEIDPVSLDPHTNSNFSAVQAYDHIYESLTTYDEKTNIIPALAQSWEITNGGKTYTFNRYFKEDGNPVTVRVLRRQKVTVPAGTYNTIVVQPIIKTKGLFSEGGQAELYFTDDDKRILVQLKSKVKILRSLDLQLTGYNPGTRLAR